MRTLLGWVDRAHACRAKLLTPAFLPLLTTRAESAAAVHVATTAGVEEGPDVKPMRSRPPDVQLLRTLCCDTFARFEAENHLVAWNARLVEEDIGWPKLCAKPALPRALCFWIGSRAVKMPTESRIEVQTWRPSWVVVVVEDIASHGDYNREEAIAEGYSKELVP